VPDPSYVDVSGISNVTFGIGDNIVNNTTPKATYADYSSQIGAVQAGVESTIAITYATGYTYGTIIWVDFDNSLSFEESEIVYTGTSGNANPTTLNANIIIPATQTPGDYMMRIGGADSGFDDYIGGTATTAPDPCYTGTYACFQDYTLRVLTELVVNPFVTSAEISWNGLADGYEMEYAVYETGSDDLTYDFEDGTLQGWTAIDADGDGFNWIVNVNTGIGDNTTHGGDAVVYSESYDNNSGVGALHPDNWLISPQVILGGSVSFWAIGQDDHWADEHFAIYVSTTGTNPSDFTQVSEEFVATNEYVEYSANLIDYTGPGYIAIRHFNVSDMFILNIDDITIVEGSDVTWIPVGTVTSPYTLEGLDPETKYIVRVKATCGEYGESDWKRTLFTTASACDAPNTLAAEVEGTTATLSWNAYQESFNLKYRKQLVSDPTVPATITFTVPDVWDDGTGYQMLLDADANTYGTIIPETGGLTEGGDVPADTYAEFEYKIPANADGALTTDNTLINQTVTIQIPAGTYDWCVTNPTPGDRVWIAAGNGNVGGRQDDFVFEPGMTYEFTVGLYGTSDGVELTATPPMGDWVVVENVTPPYELTGLDPETNYEWYVEGINSECAGDMVSEIAAFTTGEDSAEVECDKILVDEANPEWSEDFEDDAEAAGYVYDPSNPDLWTRVTPTCWEYEMYTSASQNQIGDQLDTMPQVYRSFNTTEGGHYSLRMMNRCVYAMPEFDEEYPIENLTMTLKLRQPNSLYRLQVGVFDEQGVFTVVKTLKGGTTMETKTVSFANCRVNGRIAFRNTLVSGTGMRTDYLDYSYNYIDDINFVISEEAKAEVSIAEAMESELDIEVYPNPTTGVVNVQCTMNNVQCSGIEIIDVYGKIITTVDQTATQINVSGLAAGMYFVRVTTDRGVVTKPFVKR
jgi:hypothetical protein